MMADGSAMPTASAKTEILLFIFPLIIFEWLNCFDSFLTPHRTNPLTRPDVFERRVIQQFYLDAIAELAIVDDRDLHILLARLECPLVEGAHIIEDVGH